MNVTLIGMPGSGKSVVGVLLAKQMNLNFIDGDLEIQKKHHALLKELLKNYGFEGFRQIENEVNCGICEDQSVIAPGGSIIYCPEAMEHLKSMGPVVYLKLTYEELEGRLGDLTERGVALRDGMSLRDLYEERVPLYEQYADVTVDEAGKSVGETMLAVFDALVDANLFTKE